MEDTKIRQPIVAILGHVDHGKTTLLDKIRGSSVADKEAGAITQHSGASEIPIETVKNVCGKVLDKLKINIDIPGLLFLDSPGHEAFTAIRKRGSSIADLAILIIDINEGFQPQTDESLNFLKEFKTPFIVAANKIDRIAGWVSYPGLCFIESLEKQPEHIRERVEEMIYRLIGQISERGFDCERFDRVDDFKKSIAVVPCSGQTGEGVPELLMMLTGLSQSFLKDKLKVESGRGDGSILEVKEFTGLGTTIDVILYDGEINKDDFLVIGGKEAIITKIRALLKPKPLKEIRIEKDFIKIDNVVAAAGVKIAAPGLNGVVAGSPIKFVKTKEEAEVERKKMEKECVKLEFDKQGDGIILRADTLGSLEALIHMLKQRGISVKKAEVGPVVKRDLVEAEAVSDRYIKAIFAFNVKNDVESEAKDKGIPVFRSEVIYTIFEQYEKWVTEEKEKERQEKLSKITMPAKIKLIKGFVFRQSDPAVVGVEVLEGVLKSGTRLKKDGKVIGDVKQIQKENETVSEAKRGDKVAVSINGAVVGRSIREGDTLFVAIHRNDVMMMRELGLDTKLAEESL
jgi:translation initiation factor 5B